MIALISKDNNSIEDKEINVINTLFKKGLIELFHFRKYNISDEDARYFIKRINKEYSCKVIIHQRFHLIDIYGLGGYHIGKNIPRPPVEEAKVFISRPCHSLKELEKYRKDEGIDQVLLSPIFDSISKKGVKGEFDLNELKKDLNKPRDNFRVLALGGIDGENAKRAFDLGFDGVALKGAFWNKVEQNRLDEAIKMLENIKSYVR
ncbi:MAG: thiamine phosphate synthase [Flavobacteriales bacterium]